MGVKELIHESLDELRDTMHRSGQALNVETFRRWIEDTKLVERIEEEMRSKRRIDDEVID